MTCSRCRGPVEWDVTPGLPIPPEPHTVCLMCGAVDSQRERLANMSGGDRAMKEEDDRTLARRTGRPYCDLERRILSQRMKANAELVAELAAAGFQRTEVAVAVWRSAHGVGRIRKRGRS